MLERVLEYEAAVIHAMQRMKMKQFIAVCVVQKYGRKQQLCTNCSNPYSLIMFRHSWVKIDGCSATLWFDATICIVLYRQSLIHVRTLKLRLMAKKKVSRVVSGYDRWRMHH